MNKLKNTKIKPPECFFVFGLRRRKHQPPKSIMETVIETTMPTIVTVGNLLFSVQKTFEIRLSWLNKTSPMEGKYRAAAAEKEEEEEEEAAVLELPEAVPRD